MTHAGAWRCQWPQCDRLAVTMVRTTRLPWIRVCDMHRNTWQHLLPYPDDISYVYAHRQAGRNMASGVAWQRQARP